MYGSGCAPLSYYKNENEQSSSLKKSEAIRSVVLCQLVLPYTMFAELGIRVSL